MSEPFYVMVFGLATTQAMDTLGMGPEYRSATSCSLYTVEAHVRYLNEVAGDAELVVRTAVVGAAHKKLHLAHEMFTGDALVATEEILGIHVNQDSGNAVAFGADIMGSALTHQTDLPPWSGRKLTKLEG